MIEINCDMCGRVDENLLRTIVEGVELNVCMKCSKFGKVLAPLRKEIPKPKARTFEVKKEEKIEVIVENYSDLIKRKRESVGISQKDFAAKINEKESTLHKIETGHYEPSLVLARKLERALGIKLVEFQENPNALPPAKKEKSEGFTLGDFIKIRK